MPSAKLLKQFPFEPLMNPPAARHDDLKGDRDLIYCLKARDPSYTFYKGFHNGHQVSDDRKAQVIDTFTTSAIQMPSPDPVIMRKCLVASRKATVYNRVHMCVGKSKERNQRFESETKGINERMPQTGAMTFSPAKGKTQTTHFYDSNAFKSAC